MAKQKILVTAALPYINNGPHMGHIVEFHLPVDIFYRYCRAKGHDPLYQNLIHWKNWLSKPASK